MRTRARTEVRPPARGRGAPTTSVRRRRLGCAHLALTAGPPGARADYGKLPCPQKSYSAARNLYPWIEFACNKQIHGIFNVAYNNLCTEMLEGFEQYYLASNA